MAVVLLAIMLVGLLLIATESVNHINKAAVAMFFGVTCWLIYIAYGSDFVQSIHATDYAAFLQKNAQNSLSIKQFIASSLFFKYIVQSANIVLFLLATP